MASTSLTTSKMLLWVFYVGIGSFFGGVLRFLCFYFLPFGAIFQIFCINLLGSFSLGILSQIFLSNEWRLFFVVGFLGSFTTFSTFSFEVFSLLQNSEYLFAFFYTLTSLLFSVFAIGVGIWIGKIFIPTP